MFLARKSKASRHILLWLQAWLVWLAATSHAGNAEVETSGELRARQGFFQGHYSEAASLYRSLSESHPQNKTYPLDYLMVLLSAGEFSTAETWANHRLPSGRYRAETHLAAGNINAAVQDLLAAAGQEVPRDRIWILRGYLAQMRGEFLESVEWFWKALEIDKRHPTVHLLLARSYQALSEPSSGQDPSNQTYYRRRAREEYEDALKRDPSLWTVQRDLALMAEKDQDWPAARARWSQVQVATGMTEEVRAAWRRIRPLLPTATPTPVARKPEMAAPPALTPIPIEAFAGQPGPEIAVGLSNAMRRMVFAGTAGWRAYTRDGRQLWEGRGANVYRLEQLYGERWAIKSWEGRTLKTFSRKLVLESKDPSQPLTIVNLYHNLGYMWSGGQIATRSYRGRLRIQCHGASFTLINDVPLEEYLLSVVPSEMPAWWPLEALKAQAIAARSFTLMRMHQHRRQGYNLCANVHCAAYSGVNSEHPTTRLAVEETAGKVLWKHDRMVSTFFYHACGGMSQTYNEAWEKNYTPGSGPAGVYDAEQAPAQFTGNLPFSPGDLLKFLTVAPEVFCNSRFTGVQCFRWLKIFSYAELAPLLEKRYRVGAVESIAITERSASGYVRRIKIVGSDRSITVSGDAIRSALGGLRSNLFMLLPIRQTHSEEGVPAAWMIWGGGWGHGVGFCQSGAAEMAEQGHTAEQILRHYYPETELGPHAR